ncbi:MAG: 4Fe-4S dicluster domain-containing protein [Nitrospirota bacterium]
MSIIINKKRCCGCLGFEEPKCVQACPGNLISLDSSIRKSYIASPRDCWDCMSCVKACPTGAIEIRLPYQIANYKASLKPEVGKGCIKWTCIDINGNKEEFVTKSIQEQLTYSI